MGNMCCCKKNEIPNINTNVKDSFKCPIISSCCVSTKEREHIHKHRHRKSNSKDDPHRTMVLG